jgi:hypothetical protein
MMPVRLQIRAQQVIASDIDALEERMWHDVNEYQLSLQQHLSDRDGLLNKIDRASQQLLLLKVGAELRHCATQLLLLGASHNRWLPVSAWFSKVAGRQAGCCCCSQPT